MEVRIVRRTTVSRAALVLPFTGIARAIPRQMPDARRRPSATRAMNKDSPTLDRPAFYQWVNPAVLKITSALDETSFAFPACAPRAPLSSNGFYHFWKIHCFERVSLLSRLASYSS
jgi:hypothetical protein